MKKLQLLLKNAILYTLILAQFGCNNESMDATPGSLPVSPSTLALLLYYSPSDKDFNSTVKHLFAHFKRHNVLPELRLNITTGALALNAADTQPTSNDYVINDVKSAQKCLQILNTAPSANDAATTKVLALVNKFKALPPEVTQNVQKNLEPHLKAIEDSHMHDMFIMGMHAYNKLCARTKKQKALTQNMTRLPAEKRVEVLTELVQSRKGSLMDTDQEAYACSQFINAVTRFYHIKSLLTATKANGLFEAVETLAVSNHKLYKTPSGYINPSGRFMLLINTVLDVMKEAGALSEEEVVSHQKLFTTILQDVTAKTRQTYTAAGIRSKGIEHAHQQVMPLALIAAHVYKNANFANRQNHLFSQWVDGVLVVHCRDLCPGSPETIAPCFDVLYTHLLLPTLHSRKAPPLALIVQ